MAITEQEAWIERDGKPVRIPDFVAEVVERVAFEARTDKRIDRAPASRSACRSRVMENVVSNAERRAIVDRRAGGRAAHLRHLRGACRRSPARSSSSTRVSSWADTPIARELIRRAADATFQERAGGVNVDDIVIWFDEGGALQVTDDARAEAMARRRSASCRG